jgi:hypothetical protein
MSRRSRSLNLLEPHIRLQEENFYLLLLSSDAIESETLKISPHKPHTNTLRLTDSLCLLNVSTKYCKNVVISNPDVLSVHLCHSLLYNHLNNLAKRAHDAFPTPSGFLCPSSRFNSEGYYVYLSLMEDN